MSALASPPRERAAVTAPSVTLIGVSKRYGDPSSGVVALHDITLDVAPGEFVCLVGASGCGKTTLLNLIAGLDRPTAGTVEVPRPDAGADRTPLAMLFQDSALFPWLTVAANVELPLRLRGVAKSERRATAAELLERVHLGGFGRNVRTSSRGGCASGPPWPGPSPRTPACC